MNQFKMIYKQTIFIPTTLWILSYVLSKNGIHFIIEWLNHAWVLTLLLCSLIAHKTIRQKLVKTNRRLLFVAEIVVFMLILGIYQPLYRVYNLESGRRVNGYWVTTGFMDAGTVFEVFQKIEKLPFLEQRIGYATNWSKVYISVNGKSKPNIKLNENKLILTWSGSIYSDTLIVKSDKY
jgi:hypothetical protein